MSIQKKMISAPNFLNIYVFVVKLSWVLNTKKELGKDKVQDHSRQQMLRAKNWIESLGQWEIRLFFMDRV